MRKVKVLVSAILAFWAMPGMVQAQVGDARSDIAIGVNGGALMNQVSFQPTIKQNWKFGETFGLTRERVRQIREKAIRKLRAGSRNSLLRSYLG